ncbi:transglutaminase-like cysteine peptidase [Hoeflea sp. YIM 152468]|uniref:transglutaminase-like cysteine peptidase n=1 Tax=Hoeflea sp. YIM 152468 TaxID=3031759 RepID=UPI0023D997BA|nr:transglutaminase-like cysteine peptidase [Hoeflea sp. YIM 152468]MDF1609417.1 transglutaminase-like cysteine peptidase [Hoeflea sp. YIM 152468]
MTRSKSTFLPAALATLMLSTAPLPAFAASWLRLGTVTSRPYGHVDYCSRQAADCTVRKTHRQLPPARLAVLTRINSAVNRAIAPVSDAQQYGRYEVWKVSATAGDCEDYALAKRAQLLRKGFYPEDLLLTMAHTGQEHHTVLVVRTRMGDFVLDNLTEAVLPVSASRLEFIKIQSPEHGGNWLRVTGKTGTAPTLPAG